MAKFREVPCRHYLAKGECRKGRKADYKGYCQHCGKYEPRAKVRKRNRKKEYNEKIRRNSRCNSPEFPVLQKSCMREWRLCMGKERLILQM